MASVQHVSRSMQDHQGEDRGPTLQSFAFSVDESELAPCHIKQHPNLLFKETNRIEMTWLACFFLRYPFDIDTPKDSERHGIVGVREFVVVCLVSIYSHFHG
jgi:hypothetical protein